MHTIMYIHQLYCIVCTAAVVADAQPRVQTNTSITRQCMQRMNRKQWQALKLFLESLLPHPLSPTHIILPLPDLLLQGSMALLHKTLCPVCS